MFPHLIRVLRLKKSSPVIGTQRTDGKFEFSPTIPAAERYDVLYEGMGDLQDLIKKDERTPEGSPDRVANGIIFLEIEDTIDSMLTDDIAEVTYASGRLEKCVVLDIRRLDGSLLVQRVREAA